MRRRLVLFCALVVTVAGAGWVGSPSAAPALLAAEKTCNASYGFFCPATGHLRRR